MSYGWFYAQNAYRKAYAEARRHMAYIDDWYGTSALDRKILQELCGLSFCGHMRYLHGTTSTVKDGSWRTIEYAPGKCTNCKCREFSDSPITKDDVIDVTDVLAGTVHLADLGIKPLMCAMVSTRWNGLTATQHACLLENGHEGEHVS